jgi:mannose-1-phosphate guanylyltransferase
MVFELNRERLTITLREDILKSLDEMVDGINIRNRSHAIEMVLAKALSSKKVTKALILAGGKGTRMRPFTYEMPKPMIPVKGKPLVQHIIELCRKYEVRQILLSTGYMGDKIKEHFGDGSNLGVEITYIEEKKEMGTAGPLNLARDMLRDAPFLMFNGDVLSDIDLHDFIRFHTERRGLATIALTQVEDPSAFGVARLQGERILEFVEKPKHEESKLINAGVYMLESQVLDYVPRGKSMLEKDVFPKLAAEGNLYGYHFIGQWFDTGTPEAYERAIKNWKGL